MSEVKTSQDFLLDYLKRMGEASVVCKSRWEQLGLLARLLLTLPKDEKTFEFMQHCTELTDMLAGVDLMHDVQMGIMPEPNSWEEYGMALRARRQRLGIPEPREITKFPCSCGQIHDDPWVTKPVTEVEDFEVVHDAYARRSYN